MTTHPQKEDTMSRITMELPLRLYRNQTSQDIQAMLRHNEWFPGNKKKESN